MSDINLVFKEESDLELWRANKGPRWVRDRITRCACIFKFYYPNKDFVVTAWLKDSPFHYEMEAFDIRMRDCNADERRAISSAFYNDGIPATEVKPGESGQHWHVGDLATLRFERSNLKKEYQNATA